MLRLLVVTLVASLLASGISCQQNGVWPRFYIYCSAFPNGVEIAWEAMNTVTSHTCYKATQDTVVLIHGFGSSRNSGSIVVMKDAYLQRTSNNVIAFDWQEGAASPNYFAAAPNTRLVGQRGSDLLKLTGIPASRITCVGHSLGAHCCGFIGKLFKMAAIHGLDPAGPLFAGTADANRLAKGDANLVTCSHTDNLLGIQQDICDKNYYPNGGSNQAGCNSIIGRRSNFVNDKTIYELDHMIYHAKFTKESDEPVDLVGCSHNRAPVYYAESVGRCGFSSQQADAYAVFTSGQATCHASYGCDSMGHCASRTPVTGKFYLRTNSASPFSIN